MKVRLNAAGNKTFRRLAERLSVSLTVPCCCVENYSLHANSVARGTTENLLINDRLL